MLNDREGFIFDLRWVQGNPTAQAALALYRIAQGVETLVRRRSKSLGLSRTGMQALLFLYNAHPSYRTIGSIAKKFVITPATASRLVDALEQKGLVQRTRLEEDRRAVRVELTVKGQRMIGRIVGVGEEIIKLFGVLPERECAKLAKSLKKILKAMQQKGYITASGICRTCDFFRAEVYAGKKLPHYCALTGERLSEEESYLERLDWVGETIL